MSDTLLFSPLTLRGLTVRNRLAVSPMCQYSSVDGMPTPWHTAHLVSRAVGGAGLVFVEMTAVTPEGRITPHDSGLWSDAHVPAFAEIVRQCHAHGAAVGVQLAHAGRKASTRRPWDGGGPLAPDQGAWQTAAPSALPFADGWPAPEALSLAGIQDLVAAFADAARRALAADFDTIELHAAHGYLLHEFLSPLVNRRRDAYGGDRGGRMRFLLEVAEAVRAVWPAERPLMVRLSCTDWVGGGWHLADSVVLARALRDLGVDLIDCSSGGAVVHRAPEAPGYHAPFARRVRDESGIATAVVGRIDSADLAEHLLADGAADLILVGRAFLRDPYLGLHWADALGAQVDWPAQYLRARPARSRA